MCNWIIQGCSENWQQVCEQAFIDVHLHRIYIKTLFWHVVPFGLPQWLSSKESSTGDVGLIPSSGRSPGGGYGNPLQDSCLENPTESGIRLAIVHSDARSQTRLSRLSTHSDACSAIYLLSVFLSSFFPKLKSYVNKWLILGFLHSVELKAIVNQSLMSSTGKHVLNLLFSYLSSWLKHRIYRKQVIHRA